MQWEKDVSQSGKHKNDRQKPFYGAAELTAEDALTSAVSGCSQIHPAAWCTPLKSFLFSLERSAADFPSLKLHMSSDNGALILNFAEKSSQMHIRPFSLLHSLCVSERIPQTVALSEGVNPCFLVFVHCISLRWCRCQTQRHNPNMLWNLCAEHCHSSSSGISWSVMGTEIFSIDKL